MKIKPHLSSPDAPHLAPFAVRHWSFVILPLLSILTPQLSTHAQSTPFTYQGRLNNGSAPAAGFYDLRFALFQDPAGGGAVLGPITNSAVTVSNGLFTTLLDFGPFDPDAYGRGRWLEISVRTNAADPFSVLSPRQQMTPAHSAIYAHYAGSALPGYEFNAGLLDGFDSSAFWKMEGNSGTFPGFNFLGTTDNQPLELAVNGQRALRLEPNAGGPPNFIAGSAFNSVRPGAIGSTIGGGGAQSGTNRILGDFGVIGGGFRNHIGTNGTSVISGGNANKILDLADSAVIAGGFANTIEFEGNDSVIGGGFLNTIGANASLSTIAGGQRHWVLPGASYAMIAGGSDNRAQASYTFAAGRRAMANHIGAFVWADSQDADFASTADNQFNIRAQGGVRLNTDTSLTFGSGSRLWPDQGGSIELGDSLAASAFPYVDFHFGVSANQDFNVRLINDANGQLTLSGNQQITGNLGFGAQTRQMLNLWLAEYGIGVQTATEYFRSAGNFCWFKGGVHNDGQFNPGGGVEMMRLDSAGNLKISGAFGSLSDREAKENFEPINSREVLEKVAALPLTKWSYRTDAANRHIGPTAQDFYAAFDVGLDDKSICTVDADGVALAAIQGLNQKVDAGSQRSEVRSRMLEERLQQKETEITELRQELTELKQLVHSLTHQLANSRSGGAE